MIRGLYTSALGMTTQMKKLDVISNNIANCNTNAFKSDNVVTKSFSEELMCRFGNELEASKPITRSPLGGYTHGLSVDSVYTNFSVGSLKNTEGELDLAILGDGFFVVNTVDKNGNLVEEYTRDGSFTLSENRNLVTKDGYNVIGKNGNISLPDGKISISNKGEIYVNGEFIDSIKIVDFEDKNSLRKQGSSIYKATEESLEKPFEGYVKQGNLECSNVNTVKEMIEMITLTRAYETNQHMVTIHDTTLGKAVNEISKKF